MTFLFTVYGHLFAAQLTENCKPKTGNGKIPRFQSISWKKVLDNFMQAITLSILNDSRTDFEHQGF